MKQFFLLISLSIASNFINAQTYLTIYHQIKGIIQIDLSQVDSVKFSPVGDIEVFQGNQYSLYEKELVDSLHHFDKFTGDAEMIYADYPKNITYNSATLKATVIHKSNAQIIQKGFVLGTNDSCSLFKNLKVIPQGYGNTNFSTQVDDLNCGSIYFLKAYMYTGGDTSYSPANYFITKDCPILVADSNFSLAVFPDVKTLKWDPNGWAKGSITGAVSPFAGDSNTTKIVANLQSGDYAAYYCDTITSYGENDWYLPSLEELKLIYSEKDQFKNVGGNYYWTSTENDTNQAYAMSFSTGSSTLYYKNAIGSITCVRKYDVLPVVKTLAYDNLGYFSVNIDGTIQSNGSSVITEKGLLIGLSNNLSIDNYSKMIVSTDVKDTISVKAVGLEGAQKYYARFYAKNTSGYSYGAVIDFTTKDPYPAVYTDLPVAEITGHAATVKGTIILNDTLKVLEKGFVVGLSSNPTYDSDQVWINRDTISGDTISFSSIVGLQKFLTTHYVRAYAKNKYGVNYGYEVNFISRTDTVVSDIEGNIYGTVKIGNQVWMNENLRVGQFNNGTIIKKSGQNWGEFANYPEYAFYNNNEYEYKVKFGALYNEKVVHTSKNVCPTGWKIPSAADWDELINYLGGDTIAGEKMKAISKYWNSSYNFATDESGFRGMPGGQAKYSSNYVFLNNVANWWSSSYKVGYGNQPSLIYSLFVQNKHATQRDAGSNLDGYYIRCVRK